MDFRKNGLEEIKFGKNNQKNHIAKDPFIQFFQKIGERLCFCALFLFNIFRSSMLYFYVVHIILVMLSCHIRGAEADVILLNRYFFIGAV